MNGRLFGLEFVCFTFIVCVAPGFAGDISIDGASHAKSPLTETNPPSLVSSIDRMKRRLTQGQVTDRILVSLKISEFETDNRTISRLQPEWASRGDGGDCRLIDRITGCGLWEADDIQRLTTHPQVISWSSPPLNLIAGREARYTLGGSIPVQRMTDDGIPHPSNETYGRSIVATATISNLNRIHLAIASEVSDLTTSNGIASTGNKRRIDATLELNHGETRVFGRKVVSSTGRETYQLMQATAWLNPFEIPIDPETIPVSAVEELSTPEKDIAEFNATSPFRIDSFEPADAKSRSGVLQQPNSAAVDDSVLVRHRQRIDDGRTAQELLMSIVVTEVTREDHERALRHRRSYYFRAWMPTFYSSFPSDVVEVETTGNPFASRLQCTELEFWTEGTRFCRPNCFTYRGMYLPINTWKLPKTLVESGNKLLWKSGGEIPVVTLDQNRCESISNKPFGLTVNAVPTITDMDETQIHLDVALTDLDQGAKSLRVESMRRMQATVRVRNGEVVSFGQPAVSDTGRESFLCFSVMANTVHPNGELAATDDAPISAIHPEYCDAKCSITPVNRNFANLFGAGTHQSCWADSIPTQSQQINHILDAVEHHQRPHPDAEMTQLSYRLAHPFDESSPLFADP